MLPPTLTSHHTHTLSSYLEEFLHGRHLQLRLHLVHDLVLGDLGAARAGGVHLFFKLGTAFLARLQGGERCDREQTLCVRAPSFRAVFCFLAGLASALAPVVGYVWENGGVRA